MITRRLLLLSLLTQAIYAADAGPWKWKDLSVVPETFEAPHNDEPGVKALWFAGVPYKGKPTRVFAYYSAPASAGGGQKVPAMVLIHGGGGTAFAEWVRMWNARGYAAIAMDTTGAIPQKSVDAKTLWNPARKRTEFSGPAGWGDFANVDLAPEDQWTYHAVAAAIRAHSLLRSFPEVDARRIGVTGISWGGYLTSIVAGIDSRFRFAAPVYGCGFLGEDSAWLKNFAELGKERAARWLSLWDPSQYLGRAKMPMLWLNGTNDFAYPPPSWKKSHRLPKGQRTLAFRVRMQHGHPPGAKPEEIFYFADSILRKGPRPARVRAEGFEGGKAWLRFHKPPQPVVRAELAYTRDSGRWQERKWETIASELTGDRATAAVPADATAYFLNLFDQEGRVVSGEHQER
jgi:cephalosporin-C deacetylase-like acetyl esterase